MWDSKKFSDILDGFKTKCRNDGVLFMGQKADSKEKIYLLISDELGRSEETWRESDTVKSWTRPGSTGPKTNELIERVEKILGLPAGDLGRREEKKAMEKDQKSVTTMTDFSRQAIMRCYVLMKDFLRRGIENVAAEEEFLNMRQAIEMQKIAIPETIYCQLIEAVGFLEPIVYEPQTTFACCYSDSLGYFDDEGVWHIRDGKETHFVANFISALLEIERDLDEYAMKNFYPALVG